MLVHLMQLLAAVAVLLALLLGWISVQSAARRVAALHPEAGPLRLIGGGCGGQGHGEAVAHGGSSAATRPIRIASPGRSAANAPATGGNCERCDNTACKSPDPAVLARR
jgi:hypothetical protein